jgi:hypothetical protein
MAIMLYAVRVALCASNATTLRDELADTLVETGAHVRREAWIREFANETSDAYLDIWAFCSADVVDLLIDVTIRHPMSAAYQPAASSLRGAAATTGESGKRARYPAAHGRAVTPFAVETWGRFGDDAEGLLQRVVAAATRRQAIRGHACMPGSIMTRWRAALDAVLQRGVAKSLKAARVCLERTACTIPHHRAPYVVHFVGTH